MSFETITLDAEDGIATLTLNRPDRMNAFNEQMHADLRQAVNDLAGKGDIRCLLITGAGRGFCAGADLSDRQPTAGGEFDLGASLDKNYNPLIRKLKSLNFPIITAVNGAAAGAGMSLALAGDIILAARSAYFLQAFCKIGLVPDAGSTYHLPRMIGRARALGMAMLGDKLPAETAEEWGLIWKCVDDDKLLEEARGIARRLASGPTKGLALIRQVLAAGLDNDLDTQLDLERDSQRIAGRTEDFKEGVMAFMQKRPPAFTGR